MIAIDLRVNKTHVAHITAHRRDNYVNPDYPSIYDWESKIYDCPENPTVAREPMRDPGEFKVKTGIVRHAYKDGASHLALLILQEMEREK